MDLQQNITGRCSLKLAKNGSSFSEVNMLELFTLDCGLGSQIWAAEFSNSHKRAPAYRSPLTPLGTLCAKRFRIHYPDCSVRAKRWAQ